MDVAPEFRNCFKDSIIEIIDTETDTAERFLEELRIILHRYQLRKRVRTSSSEGMPTKAQMKANAEAIRRNVLELIQQLYGEAGGIRFYLINGIQLFHPEHAGYRSLEKLSRTLRGVKFGCDDFLDELSDDLEDARYEPIEENGYLDTCSPINYLAYEIARIIDEVLGEIPNSYIYEGQNRTSQIDGKFARILTVCFDEIERGIQRDIRSLMKIALKNLYESKG